MDSEPEKVTKRLYLSLYHPSLAGDYIDVWVNPTPDTAAAWGDYQTELKKTTALLKRAEHFPSMKRAAQLDAQKAIFDDARERLLSELWGMPLEDVKAMSKVNLPLFEWASIQTWTLIKAHQEAVNERLHP